MPTIGDSQHDQLVLQELLLLLVQLPPLALLLPEPLLELRHKLVGLVLRLGLDFNDSDFVFTFCYF